jgi:hypothetical protein
VEERNRDIEVLNRFLYQAWGGISDILHGEISHQAAKEIARLPGPLWQNRTWMHLTVPPGVQANQDGGLTLKVPRTGVHLYQTEVRLLLWLLFPAIDVDVEFLICGLFHFDVLRILKILKRIIAKRRLACSTRTRTAESNF